ncbi:MAG: putative glycoside hydrolase [Candidatus Dormibacteria bacterium]
MKGATTILALLGLIAVAGGVSVGSAPLPTRQHDAAPSTAAPGVTAGVDAQAGAVDVGIGGSSVELNATGLPSSSDSPLTGSASSSASPTASASSSTTGGVYEAADPASTASTIGLWAADWGGAAGSRSSAGWQAAAENDSILIGNAGVYSKWIPQLHAWNPNLTILVYNLGPYLQKGSSEFTTIEQQDPSWFAHDAKGNLINLRRFPSNYLMDMGNAAYRAWHAQQLAATVKQDGFDGAMVDSVGVAALSTGYASGTPIDTATGKPYTDAEYLANSVLLLDADKAALDGKYLAFNGLISGTEYERDTNILATSTADAGISELFLRQPDSPITSFPSTSELDSTLEMMSSMAAHGKALLGWTKVWVSASSSQVAKWEQYALAVYLLGKQSNSYWDFMPSHDADNTVVSYSNMKDQLGAPLGPYTTNGSTLSRSFQDGSVSLNTSTDTATITVT